jgi:hypothetical protein
MYNREVLLKRSRGAEVEGISRHGNLLVASILSNLLLLYTRHCGNEDAASTVSDVYRYIIRESQYPYAGEVK